MQTSNSLGFVVWGVKNGFQNNLFSHNLSESIRTTLIDIQELCMPQYSDFYAIERIGGDTLVSLYDPTMMDYSGSRKAYIVFSIIFPQGIAPSGDVFELLGSFKNYYKVESNGLPSQEIFHRKLIEFNAKSATSTNTSGGNLIGYKNYVSFGEIKEVFTDLDILDYRKIFFFDRPNTYVSSNPNFVAVTSLVRKYRIEIRNYNEQNYQILINGITLNSPLIKQLAPGIIEINDLNKTDKIEIRRRGSSQAFESFYARDRQHVLLPVPRVDYPEQFIIENFDPSHYLVKVNNREMQTSFINGNTVSVAISVEFVLVEIIDRQTNAVVQTHNTRLNKSYKMVFSGANSRTNRTSGPATGILGGNSDGIGIVVPKKTEQKSYRKTLIFLSVCVFMVGFGLTAWQLKFFGPYPPPPPLVEVSTTNEVTDTTKLPPVDLFIETNDYPGYKLKENYSDFKKEDGFTEGNNDKYRLKDGKLEIKYKNVDGTKSKWQTMNKVTLNTVLAKYFEKVKPTVTLPESPNKETTTQSGNSNNSGSTSSTSVNSSGNSANNSPNVDWCAKLTNALNTISTSTNNLTQSLKEEAKNRAVKAMKEINNNKDYNSCQDKIKLIKAKQDSIYQMK